MKSEDSSRISILDSFRFIAILLVILYHYLYRFTDKEGLYPYGNSFANFTLVEYGYLGVQLFFIISGFVIFLTLEKSNNITEFLIKRFIRLFPMLLICSIATFALVRLLDTKNQFPHFQNSALNFLPSLTFSEPILWKQFVNPNINSFVDGVYWTLVIEVRFYLVASVLYFLDKKSFFNNWVKLSVLVFTMHSAIYVNNELYRYSSLLSKVDGIFDLLFFPEYNIFFTLGMFFFALYEKREVKKTQIGVIWLIVLLEAFLFLKGVECGFLTAFIALFLIFIFKPQWLTPLTNHVVQTIGLVSYPLYLLHQNIGVLSIHSLASNIQDKNGITSLLAATFALVFCSYCLHAYVDQPIQKHLKSLFFPIKTKFQESSKANYQV